MVLPGGHARGARAVIVFAKWPSLGSGKQRLARDLGRSAARDLARAFLADTLALAARADGQVVVALAPASAGRQVRRLAPGATCVPQRIGGFGVRLRAALDEGLRLASAVVLIGSDTPTLPAARIDHAFALLESGADIALGPSDDGGFYLIGCRAPLPPSLFRALPWSTSAVLAETLARAAACRLSVAQLPVWYDVDDLGSLGRLRGDVSGLRRARHTAQALGRLARAA